MSSFTELQKNDNDKKKTWGGTSSGEAPSYTVKNLQTDLKKVGVYTASVDGDFGNMTLKSLKIFQWNCANVKACLKNKSRIPRIQNSSIGITGKLNKASYDELQSWIRASQSVTGDLVRIAFSDFSNIEASSNFKKIVSASVNKDEIVVSSEALQLLKDMNKHAKSKSVTIKINQAFRVHGVKVTGSVVTPATKSQHLIGHAIDCNIVDGGNWNNSLAFKNNKATDNAKKLIKELKKSGYRWGGDFSKADSPHFDKKLVPTEFSYDAKFFLNQRMVSEGHSIHKELIVKDAK